jgi:hypothetical protein
MCAQNALAEAGIRLYGGVTGTVDSAAKAYAEGSSSIIPMPNATTTGKASTAVIRRVTRGAAGIMENKPEMVSGQE